METPCRIAQKDVRLPCLCRCHGIINNGSRICSFLAADHVNPGSVRPFLQLFAGGGAECIRSGEHHFLSLILELSCELTDGCRLAHTIYPDHKYD